MNYADWKDISLGWALASSVFVIRSFGPYYVRLTVSSFLSQ